MILRSGHFGVSCASVGGGQSPPHEEGWLRE